MPSKRYTTVAARVSTDLAEQIRDAASREGVTTSMWLVRRAKNNLRRTGRIAQTLSEQTTIEAR